MENGKSQKTTQSTLSVTEAPRKSGVPSRQEMYKILKERSLQLQGGSSQQEEKKE